MVQSCILFRKRILFQYISETIFQSIHGNLLNNGTQVYIVNTSNWLILPVHEYVTPENVDDVNFMPIQKVSVSDIHQSNADPDSQTEISYLDPYADPEQVNLFW